MIHYEVDIDLFGVEEARRQSVKVDPQAQAALGYFDEAKKLLELRAPRSSAGLETSSSCPYP